MRIASIDPGTNIAGFAVLELPAFTRRARYLAHGDLVQRGVDSKIERLRGLSHDVGELLNEYLVAWVVLETAFVGPWANAGLVVSEARGVVMGVAFARELLVAEYAAKSIKKAATGSGNARKEDVRRAMLARFDLARASPDSGDALGIAYTHALALGWTGR